MTFNLINKLNPFARLNPKNHQELPWLDQPNAQEQVERKFKQKKFDQQTYQLLLNWIDQGYIIVKNIIPETLIDELVDELANLFFLDAPLEGFQIEGILKEGLPTSLPHKEVLALDLETRKALVNSIWRVHAFHERSKAAKAIFDNPELQNLVSLILGKPSFAQYSINFLHGTEQPLHEDMAVFYINPLNYLIGVWIALEDISQDSGPLILCPGSHQHTSVKSFFTNYPEQNLKNSEPEKMPLYTEYVNCRAENFPKKEFIAHKGDILLWHGMLIHGGAKINNPALTRKSMVIHFVGEDCDRVANAKGPFNW